MTHTRKPPAEPQLQYSARGLDQLLHTAHQQRIRQLRKIQQMRRHSEATAALHHSWQLKQKEEEEHQRHIQEERQQAAKAKHQHEQLIEVRLYAFVPHVLTFDVMLLCCINLSKLLHWKTRLGLNWLSCLHGTALSHWHVFGNMQSHVCMRMAVCL